MVFPSMKALTIQAKGQMWRLVQLLSILIPIIHLETEEMTTDRSADVVVHCESDLSQGSIYYLDPVSTRPSKKKAMMVLGVS